MQSSLDWEGALCAHKWAEKEPKKNTKLCPKKSEPSAGHSRILCLTLKLLHFTQHASLSPQSVNSGLPFGARRGLVVRDTRSEGGPVTRRERERPYEDVRFPRPDKISLLSPENISPHSLKHINCNVLCMTAEIKREMAFGHVRERKGIAHSLLGEANQKSLRKESCAPSSGVPGYWSPNFCPPVRSV